MKCRPNRRWGWSLVTVMASALSGCWSLRHQCSAAVRGWSPGAGERLCAGPLQVRVFGTGETVLLLAHQIVASGNYFGAAYDAIGRRVRVDGWEPALAFLNHNGVPVVIADGADDPTPVPGRVRYLVERWPNVRRHVHPYADHMLPITNARWCRTLIDAATTPFVETPSVTGGET